MSLTEAAKVEHKQTLAIKTINKRLEFTLSFIQFAVDETLLKPFNTRRLKIKETRKNVDKRDMFNKDDLNFFLDILRPKEMLKYISTELKDDPKKK